MSSNTHWSPCWLIINVLSSLSIPVYQSMSLFVQRIAQCVAQQPTRGLFQGKPRKYVKVSTCRQLVVRASGESLLVSGIFIYILPFFIYIFKSIIYIFTHFQSIYCQHLYIFSVISYITSIFIYIFYFLIYYVNFLYILCFLYIISVLYILLTFLSFFTNGPSYTCCHIVAIGLFKFEKARVLRIDG